MSETTPRPVRHCPNPDCPALADTGRVSEYTVDSIACSDCGGALADGPAPATMSRRRTAGPEPYAGRLVTLLVSRGDRLQLVRDRLEQAGIPSFVQGQQASRMFGGVTTTRLLVREEDEDRARVEVESFADAEDVVVGQDEDPAETERPRSGGIKWLALIGFVMLALKLIASALRD